jgi:hypothetical protein
MRFEVQGSDEAGFVDNLVPALAEQMAWGALVSREAVETEIDVMLTSLREPADADDHRDDRAVHRDVHPPAPPRGAA